MPRLKAETLIRAYFDAFNRADWAGMTACLAPNVRHHVNQGGVREGLEAFRAFLRHMDACYSEEVKDLVVMATEDGRRAAAEFLIHGVYERTDAGLPEAKGQAYRLPAGSFFALDGGKITRVTTYYNLKDWTRQVEEQA